MSILENILRFISNPVDGNELPQQILTINVTVSFIGLVLTTIVFLIATYQWKANTEIRDQFQPVVIITLALSLRILVNFTDRLIEFYFNGTRELVVVNVFQTIPWILVYVGLVPVFKNLIKVPKRRQYQIKRIMRTIYITIFLLIFLTMLGFIPTGDELGGAIASFGLLIVTLVLWGLVITIWREARQNSAKLVVIRLQMVTLGNLMIALSFTSTPIVIIMAITGNFGPTAAAVNNLVIVLLTVIASYFFYGTFFTPMWMKKYHGLATAEESLI